MTRVTVTLDADQIEMLDRWRNQTRPEARLARASAVRHAVNIFLDAVIERAEFDISPDQATRIRKQITDCWKAAL